MKRKKSTGLIKARDSVMEKIDRWKVLFGEWHPAPQLSNSSPDGGNCPLLPVFTVSDLTNHPNHSSFIRSISTFKPLSTFCTHIKKACKEPFLLYAPNKLCTNYKLVKRIYMKKLWVWELCPTFAMHNTRNRLGLPAFCIAFSFKTKVYRVLLRTKCRLQSEAFFPENPKASWKPYYSHL